jgi:PAS domain S-box-containing protein
MKIEERTTSLENKIDELKKSEDRYHKMIEEVRDYAIILLDVDGTILNWNQGAQNIKGYSEKEILGKNFRLFYRPEDRQALLPEKLIQEAVEKGKAMHEGPRVRKDKTTFWGSVVITALHDDNGNIIGFSKVTRHLTEKKKAENKLIEYAAQLEEQNKELAQYAYVTSHDLQEPLRKIQTFASIADTSDDIGLIKTYLDKISVSAGRMKNLIRSVLDYTSISEGENIIADTDLNVVISDVEKDYELMTQEKGATIRYASLPVVRGNPIQLYQLFSNLISNALKFNEGKPVIDISAQAASGDNLRDHPSLSRELTYIKITVDDNGIGFEQKYAGHIFELFKRLNEKTKYSGTGLGLALCKKIAEKHQGAISAHSVPGQGTRFEILLPADRN